MKLTLSCLLAVIFAFWSLPEAVASPSRRARCATECYLSCVTSGTPKAVYCNCPIRDSEDECTYVTDAMIDASIVSTVPGVETTYKNAHTISVRILEPIPAAFIYVFEYSAISIDVDQWMFAGASSTPQITFTIPDSCRDFQFRVIIVLRSTDPTHQLAVLLPRAIPVDLPSFTVSEEMIALDTPRQSSDGQSLHISVSWLNPTGYSDSDIYGYEAPVAYPIRCMVPEDSLSQPQIEMVQQGGRLHLNLPIDVLDEKCRIFLQVLMLPRCIRLDPFEVQASIELDCLKFPMLPYCKREMTPQCISSVSVTSKNGAAVVSWNPPTPSQLPLHYLVSHGLAQTQGFAPFVTRKIVHGKESKISGTQSSIELLVQRDVQYGIQVCAIYSDRPSSKNPFNVVPVVAFTCSTCNNGTENCQECTRIEDNVSIECAKLGPDCGANVTAPTHGHGGRRPGKLDIKQVAASPVNPTTLQRHSKIHSSDHSYPVHNEFDGLPFETNATLEHLLTNPAEESTTTTTKMTLLSSTTPVTTQTPPLTPPMSTRATTRTTTSSPKKPAKTTSKTTSTPSTSTTGATDAASSEQGGKVLHRDNVRLHQPKMAKPCKQKNGIVCEFGCLDDLRCDCPKSEQSCIRGISCPFVKDLRAIYDNSTKTLRLFSSQISSVLKNASVYDKVYLEFGEILPVAPARLDSKEIPIRDDPTLEYTFASNEKDRAVISLDQPNVTSLFDTIPYIMSVDRPIRVGDLSYGLSFCALNTSLVPVIMDNVFMEQSLFNENSINSFTQTLLSPVELNEEAAAQSNAKRSLMLVLGPILIVLATMFFVGVLLCANAVRDKKRSMTTSSRIVGHNRVVVRDQPTMKFTGYRSNPATAMPLVTNAAVATAYPQAASTTGAQAASKYYVRNVHF